MFLMFSVNYMQWSPSETKSLS